MRIDLRIVLTMMVCLSLAVAQAGERYAFLVGVREYEPTELTSLEYTEKDVTDLAAALKQAGYPAENIVLMTKPSAHPNRGTCQSLRTFKKNCC